MRRAAAGHEEAPVSEPADQHPPHLGCQGLEESAIITAAFKPDGILITGDMIGSACAWNVTTRHTTRLVQGKPNGSGFAMLSNGGRLFAASSETGLNQPLNLWDTFTGGKIASDPSKTYSGTGTYPDVLSSTGLLANIDQATAPKTAVIWNLRTGKNSPC